MKLWQRLFTAFLRFHLMRFFGRSQSFKNYINLVMQRNQQNIVDSVIGCCWWILCSCYNN